jgi:hypothetical protein
MKDRRLGTRLGHDREVGARGEHRLVEVDAAMGRLLVKPTLDT